MNIIDKVASRIIKSMAYDREGFKNKIGAHIRGALLEYYKHTLATKNGHTEYVNHWKREVKRLIEQELPVVLIDEIRGFKDRYKALSEVVAYTKQQDSSFQRIAENIVLRDYRIKKLKNKLAETDTIKFWEMVESIASISLS